MEDAEKLAVCLHWQLPWCGFVAVLVVVGRTPDLSEAAGTGHC